MSKVIVTGGAGFIGSRIVNMLVSAGYEVLVIDDLSTGSLQNLNNNISCDSNGKVKLIQLNICNSMLSDILKHIINDRIYGIIHLAAMVSLDKTRTQPSKALEINVLGTHKVLEAALDLEAEIIVVTSSAAVYGEPVFLPISEVHPLDPLSIYGASKLAAEKIAFAFGREFGLRVSALRVFNVYGPGMRPGPYAGVVLRFIESLLKGEAPVIHGDGLQTRDFVYVDDVAKAHVKALEGRALGVFNVGSGVETRIIDLYRLVCREIGRCPKPRYERRRPGDVVRSVADISRIRDALGWQPKVGLEEGIKKTIEYYRGGTRLSHSNHES